MNNDVSGNLPDLFDRKLAALHGVPDVVHTKATTLRGDVDPLVGNVQTFIVQTYRHAEQGDTLFLECVDKDTHYRLMIPPKVTSVIARQRDALSTMLRRKIAKRVAGERKDRGELPGFMKAKVKAVNE